ncbi:hypothetical protein ND982_28190 [Vibrio diabolicus]|nr:hypothetical protein [Vibrio diabolicus]
MKNTEKTSFNPHKKIPLSNIGVIIISMILDFLKEIEVKKLYATAVLLLTSTVAYFLFGLTRLILGS